MIVIHNVCILPVHTRLIFFLFYLLLLGSINLICVPLGCIVSGTLTQPFGRKPSMIALTLPFILAWLMFHVASTVIELYLALALCGLCGGILEAPVSVYKGFNSYVFYVSIVFFISSFLNTSYKNIYV